MLLASHPRCEVATPTVVMRQAPPPASIVDIASGVAPSQLPALVRLAPGEHVIAVGDRPVSGDLEAGAVLADASPHAGGYLDLTVTGAVGPRRLLVLLH